MNTLFKRIEELGRYQIRHAALKDEEIEHLTENWQYQVQAASSKLYDHKGRVKISILENFRRQTYGDELFIGDEGPYTDYADWNPKHWCKNFLSNPVSGLKQFSRQRLSGLSRGLRKSLIEKYNILKREDAIHLLQKYPVSKTPGNPFSFHYKGCAFNARWAIQIYFINLLNKHLSGDIKKYASFVNLDLGSAYGIFSYLFKSEHTNTKHILVDFPDQMVLAAYFLSKIQPTAKIATILEYSDQECIDRKFIEAYDYVLVPVTFFEKIEPNAIDMLTNFVSLGEMKPKWFHYYLHSKLFRKTPYFFTCNRFVSSPRHEPTHDTSITILNYPLDQFKRILFDINPLFIYNIKQKHKFFFEKRPMSSYQFDFIGMRE